MTVAVVVIINSNGQLNTYWKTMFESAQQFLDEVARIVISNGIYLRSYRRTVTL